jgi:hypothetical protein
MICMSIIPVCLFERGGVPYQAGASLVVAIKAPVRDVFIRTEIVSHQHDIYIRQIVFLQEVHQLEEDGALPGLKYMIRRRRIQPVVLYLQQNVATTCGLLSYELSSEAQSSRACPVGDPDAVEKDEQFITSCDDVLGSSTAEY